MQRTIRASRLAARVATLLLFAVGSANAAAAACPDAPRVPARIVTDQGAVTLALDRERAPASVANFLAYARDGFYAGTIFHRVIPGFMIQGGGLTPGLERKATRDPVVNESDNGLSNERATVAMARTRDPDSANAQFFINLADNPNLDASAGEPGYTVFGRVTAGMDVVDAIARVPTTRRAGRRNVPREPVIIEAVEVAPNGCNGTSGSDSAEGE